MPNEARLQFKSVFISYSSVDRSFVHQLANDLKERSVSVWLDDSEIRPGDPLVRRIEQGLCESDLLLLVLSPEALKSGWVRSELEAKLLEELSEQDVKVIPLLLRSVVMPPLLRGKLYIDFRKNYMKGLNLLLNALSTSPDYSLFEEPTRDRTFFQTAKHRSLEMAGMGFLLPGAFPAFLIAYLCSKHYHGEHGPSFHAILGVLVLSVFLAMTAFAYLSILAAIGYHRWTTLQGIAHPVNLFRSSLQAPSPFPRTSLRLQDVVFITERISLSKCDETVLDIKDVSEVKVLFSLWNNNAFAIKVFEISSIIHRRQPSVAYFGGPRALVIIDQDKSIADPTNTYEIPAGESCSFNIAYRITRTHHDYIAFSLLMRYTEPTGQIRQIGSDALYFDFAGERAVFLRKGEAYPGGSAFERQFVAESYRLYLVPEERTK